LLHANHNKKKFLHCPFTKVASNFGGTGRELS
jgi:hypothetical protein